MKNLRSYLGGIAMLALGLCFTACSDDDGPEYSKTVLQNTELKSILVSQGYQFNEHGNLLLDDKANQTTSLDLSNTNISQDALSELSILPNLTDVNLSNNGYTKSFDFSKLPDQITGVDLTDNDIYDYDNLVKVDVAENGDETVTNMHNINKLYLPEVAKYNIKQLMRFYCKNKTAIDDGSMDVKMANASGSLEKYTTLRDVPDDVFRTYLQTNFSDLFKGQTDKIDISNVFGIDQRTKQIYVLDNVENLEGIQYIVQSPYWEGSAVVIYSYTNANMPYLEWSENIGNITLYNVNMAKDPNFDNATNLKMVYFVNVSGIQNLDMSHSTIFGQRTAEVEFDGATASGIILTDCADLENVVLPNKSDLKTAQVAIECLPKLKTFDLDKFTGLSQLQIGDLPSTYNLVFPTLTEFDADGMVTFAISTKAYETFKEKADAFIDKYYKSANPKRLNGSMMLVGENNEGYVGYIWF